MNEPPVAGSWLPARKAFRKHRNDCATRSERAELRSVVNATSIPGYQNEP